MATSCTRWNSLSMPLVLLTIFTLNIISITCDTQTRTTKSNDEITSAQHRQTTRSLDHSRPNSLTLDDEEFTELRHQKKVIHRLIGGHVRSEKSKNVSLTIETKTDKNNKAKDNNNDSEEIKDNDSSDTDEASWDNDALIVSSAGNGKEKTSRNEDDDEKKTLSQQVKEGKYGLIQNEITPSSRGKKRPGIISYLSNPEVPRDNARNLGGLDEDDIWLAENHMLVIRGGNFPDHEKTESSNFHENSEWSPIDNYEAPKRQIKIPSRPKIPPPFPVQLIDDGPIRLIGANETTSNSETTLNDNNDEFESYEKGFLPGQGPYFADTKNISVIGKNFTNTEDQMRKNADREQNEKTKTGHVPERNSDSPINFYPSLPPGAVFVIPPNNHSDYDDDDQSIYYPKPYSFYYKQDNSTPVPPGPLVPGIILPPPPDFFAPAEDKKPITKSYPTKYGKRPCATSPTTPSTTSLHPTDYPARKSSQKLHKFDTTSSSIVGRVPTTKYVSRGGSLTMKPVNTIKQKITTTERTIIDKLRAREKITLPRIESTTAFIDHETNLEITDYHSPRPNSLEDRAIDESTKKPKNHWLPRIISKSIPLITYYSSSTASSLQQPNKAKPSLSEHVTTEKPTIGGNHRTSYYFYEEANDDTTVTTPNPNVYYRATTAETPYYGIQEVRTRQKLREQREQEKKSYYEAQTVTTQRTPVNYRSQSLDDVSRTSSRYNYPNTGKNSILSSRNKGQRMLVESSPSYYEEDTTERSKFSLSYGTTTKRPSYREKTRNDDHYGYDRETEPKPIYQYSYESADYTKREGQQKQLQLQQEQLEQQLQQQQLQLQKQQLQQQQQQQQQKDYYKTESPEKSYYDRGSQHVTEIPETFDEWQDIRDDSQQYDYDISETLPERGIPRENDNNEYINNLAISYGTTTPKTTTIKPINIEPTVNPHQTYYTKHDEQLLDDVTREYFTNFGKKLANEITSITTPIYDKNRVITERPNYEKIETFSSVDYDNTREMPNIYETPKVRVHYGDQAQRPYSLDSDTLINYKEPRPAIESQSEWITGYRPEQTTSRPLSSYRQHHTEIVANDYTRDNVAFKRLRNYGETSDMIDRTNVGSTTNFVPIDDYTRNGNRQVYPSTRPVSLEADIDVNYRDPRPAINPDAEYIDPSVIRNRNNDNNNNKINRNNNGNPDKSSYFAYRLPGDGGHFYFLTPQAISQRHDENNDYVYSRPRGTRFSRQRRRGLRNF